MIRIIFGIFFIYVYYILLLKKVDFFDNVISIYAYSVLITLITFCVFCSIKWLVYVLRANYKFKRDYIRYLYDNFLSYFIPIIAFSFIFSSFQVFSIDLVFLLFFMIVLWFDGSGSISRKLWVYRSYDFKEIPDDGVLQLNLVDALVSKVTIFCIAVFFGGLILKFLYLMN